MSLAEASTYENVLADYVSGTTLQFGSAADDTRIDGATLVDGEASNNFENLATQESASIDSIVSWWGIERTEDTLAALSEWRRVLKEGGTLAVVIRDGDIQEHWQHAPHTFTAKSLQNLIRHAGGFEITRVAEIEGEGSWLVVAQRNTVLDLRNLLGLQASVLADAASKSEAHRAELCFQFGTILLRAGEATLAAPCFEMALRHIEGEGDSAEHAEGLFGLGMCRTLQRQWASAIDCLERAIDLDPDNMEARRWLGLAHLECDGETAGSMGGPQGALG